MFNLKVKVDIVPFDIFDNLILFITFTAGGVPLGVCVFGQGKSGKKTFLNEFLRTSGLISELPLCKEEIKGGLKTSYRNWTNKGEVAFTIIPGKDVTLVALSRCSDNMDFSQNQYF